MDKLKKEKKLSMEMVEGCGIISYCEMCILKSDAKGDVNYSLFAELHCT